MLASQAVAWNQWEVYQALTPKRRKAPRREPLCASNLAKWRLDGESNPDLLLDRQLSLPLNDRAVSFEDTT